MMGGGPGYGMGSGMGPGMMGGGYGPGYAALNLSDEQRKNIDAIQEEMWRKQGELMGAMHAQSYRMHDFGKADDAAARKAFDEMAAAHKQMFETRLDARKRIDAVLTPEQRKQVGRSPWSRDASLSSGRARASRSCSSGTDRRVPLRALRRSRMNLKANGSAISTPNPSAAIRA
jgi:Spy/CpxP family protein refolding chaperone